MLSNWFNRKKQAAVPAQPPAPVATAHDPYEFMSNDAARDAILKAVLEDDLGTVKSIARHHPDCARWVIEAKGSSIGGEPIRTPLTFYPAGAGHVRVLQWLLDNGAELEARSNMLNHTALYHAAQRGQIESVRVLLAAGADAYTRAEVVTPHTAVQAARQGGFEDIAQLIESEQQRAQSVASLATRADRVLIAPKITFTQKP